MSWRKYLLVPGLALKGRGHGRRPGDAWDAYWGAVHRTGPEGDVLWDGAGEQELSWWLATARQHLDSSLPVLDVGCGNGRVSRLLAGAFPAVLGVDLSPAAIEVAERESRGMPGVRFRQLDVTAPGAGAALAAELGPANVVVRGVLHVLDPQERQRAAAALHDVLGGRGALLLLETNWPGDLLGYLEHLGARPGRLPGAVSRLIEFGLPRPSRFGPVELARTFPADGWVTVTSGPVDIAPVRSLGPRGAAAIPGYHAVLRPAPAAATAGPGADTAEQGM